MERIEYLLKQNLSRSVFKAELYSLIRPEIVVVESYRPYKYWINGKRTSKLPGVERINVHSIKDLREMAQNYLEG